MTVKLDMLRHLIGPHAQPAPPRRPAPAWPQEVDDTSDDDVRQAADFVKQSYREADGDDARNREDEFETLGSSIAPVARALMVNHLRVAVRQPTNTDTNAATEIARFIVDAHRKARGEAA